MEYLFGSSSKSDEEARARSTSRSRSLKKEGETESDCFARIEREAANLNNKMATMSDEAVQKLLDATLKAQEERFRKKELEQEDRFLKKELAQEDRFLKKMEEMQQKLGAAGATNPPTARAHTTTKTNVICRDSIPVITKSSSVMEVDRWMQVVIGEAQAASIDLDTDRTCIAKVRALVPTGVVELVKATIDLKDPTLHEKYPDKDYTGLLKKILEHFKTRACDMDLGQDLATRTQHASESIEEYKEELMRMAGHSKLGKFCDMEDQEPIEAMVEIFLIKGMKRQDWRTELAKEKNGRSLTEIMELLVRLERSEASRKSAKTSSVETNATSTYKHQKGGSGGAGGANGNAPRQYATTKEEWLKTIDCHRCGQRGHISMTCDNARKKTTNNNTWVDVKDSNKDGSKGTSVGSNSVTVAQR
jgi:hypothetical protein